MSENNKNIVFYLNLCSYNNLSFFFLFEIIFLAHSSMHFIVFGHLVNFEILGTKKILLFFLIF